MFKYLIGFMVILTGSIILMSGCGHSSSAKVYKIGFSQCTMDDIWRVQMLKEMRREIHLINDVELKLTLKDAGKNIIQQERDIQDLVSSGIDVLIVSPYRSTPLKHIVDSVVNLGVPVILIDRHIKIDSENVYYVGANNKQIGIEVGTEVARLLPNGGHILSFTGLLGSRPAQQRADGFMQVMKKNKKFIVETISCDWTEETAYREMQDIIKSNAKFDLIFAHNDFMAKGVIRAFGESDKKMPKIIGIDGLNAPGYGIDLVLDSTLTATFTYPTGGDAAIQTAYKVLSFHTAPKNKVLNSVLIDYSNVQAIKIQRDEIDQQIEKIDQQNKIIKDRELEISKQQKQDKKILLILILLTVLLLGTVFFLRPRLIKKRIESENEYEYQFPIPFLPEVSKNDKEIINEIKRVVLNNLINEKICIQFVSDQLKISHSTLYRRIKQITGLKGVELLMLIRLQQAEKLLKTTNLSIKEVAFQTGFNTSSYFSTSFVKLYGISPVKYRIENEE